MDQNDNSKLLTKIQRQNYFHKLFKSLEPISKAFFLFGFALWLLCPILGIIPLLLFCQINVSRNTKPLNFLSLNSFCLVLVFLTLVTSASTHVIYADLEVYINIYTGLGNMSFIEYMNSMKIEPISFLIPNIIKYLLGDNEQYFILTQSLTMNLAYMLLAIIFMPSYYPTIILLNVTSVSYFSHMFLMRQFYSFIFVIPLVYTPSLTLKCVLLILGLYTHSSSVIICIPVILFHALQISFRFQNLNYNLMNLFIALKNKISNSLKNKYVFTSIFLLLTILLYFVYLNLINSSFINELAPNLSARVDRYSSNNLDDVIGIEGEGLFRSLILDLFFISASVIMLDLKKASFSCYLWCVVFISSILYLTAFFYFELPMFGRLIYLLRGLSGFFYTIPLESGKLNNKFNFFSAIIFLAIFLKILYFVYAIYLSSIQDRSPIWFGTPLYSNIFNYIDYLYNLF